MVHRRRPTSPPLLICAAARRVFSTQSPGVAARLLVVNVVLARGPRPAADPATVGGASRWAFPHAGKSRHFDREGQNSKSCRGQKSWWRGQKSSRRLKGANLLGRRQTAPHRTCEHGTRGLEHTRIDATPTTLVWPAQSTVRSSRFARLCRPVGTSEWTQRRQIRCNGLAMWDEDARCSCLCGPSPPRRTCTLPVAGARVCRGREVGAGFEFRWADSG